MIAVKDIVNYICCSISILVSLFCLFKVLNSSRKLNSLADFMHGEVFSVRFESLMMNFFGDDKNTKAIFEPIVPWFKERLQNSQTSIPSDDLMFID